MKLGHPAGQLHPSASTQAGGKAATAMIMLFSAFWAFGMNGRKSNVFLMLLTIF